MRNALGRILERVKPVGQCNQNSCTTVPGDGSTPDLEPFSAALKKCDHLNDPALHPLIDQAIVDLTSAAVVLGVTVSPVRGATGTAPVSAIAVKNIPETPAVPVGGGPVLGGVPK